MYRHGFIILCLGLMVGCGDLRPAPEVELTSTRIASEDPTAEPIHSVESGHHVITVRLVFTAQGPCRELEAGLTRDYPAGYLLRIEATEMDEACGDDSPHILYTAVLTGLPEGRHPLRVVHVGADGRTLSRTTLEHPVVVTAPPDPQP